MASRPGSEAARPLRQEHAQDHEGDGARRLGPAAPRADADRGDAPLRRHDARADRGRRARQRVRPRAAAAAAARGGEDRRRRRAHGRPRPRRPVQRPDHPPGVRARAAAARRGQGGQVHRRRQEGPLDLRVPPLRDRGRVHRLHRPARVRRRAGDRAPRRRALHRGRDRPRRARLQRLRLAARPDRDRARPAPDLRRHPRDRRGGAPRRRDARRLHLRAGAGGDPGAAAAGLPRDAGLPGAARVGGVGAGRPDDGDAERVQERGRADRHADAADEPRPPGRDHPGDPGSGRRRRSAFARDKRRLNSGFRRSD